MKEKVKKVGFRVLIVMAVLFYGTPLVIALSGQIFSVPIHQEMENIQQIKLLDTSGRDEIVLMTLDDSEISSFMEQLLSMKAGQYVNDPPTALGPLTVRILYADGAADYIGSDICRYYDASGVETGRGWYYIGREELYELFCIYVDPKLLPDHNK